ncbi:DUF1499 domain-containing protein [Stagnihabitans tardus]|uniref:DUF1499 domain-containing protein n=1 Tax=Stagnihabitans tardus TaxID=2699202 RepID=A0AAE4Y793_9RHOB|nr:DUF1499 domain-containing protein [Stagnihabitans tardus]NBZ86081.1 DUF1499 domain-containing protein [Stagnihabitans tardus]
MKSAALLILTILAGLQIYIRLAVADPAEWHIDLATARPESLIPNPSPEITVQVDGAFVDLTPADPQATLARLAEIAAATPRTTVFAGSVAEGHVTWVTRSLLWGFPDYTTAQITPQGLTIYARLRFGRGDLGVNGARLKGWLGQL